MKRGASHLEVILSFVIFVTFVLFLIIFLSPTENTDLSDSIILRIQDSFEKEATIELATLFVKSTDAGCVNVDFSGLGLDGGSLVYDAIPSQGRQGRGITASINSYDSSFSSDTVSFESESAEDAFYVAISDEFALNSQDICTTGVVDHETGSLEYETIISNNSAYSLKARYDSDYDLLKQELNIPVGVDFAIVTKDYQMETNVPEGVDVIAKTFNYQVLYVNGTKEYQQVIFKIW